MPEIEAHRLVDDLYRARLVGDDGVVALIRDVKPEIEKSEGEVLAGIRPEHWSRVRHLPK